MQALGNVELLEEKSLAVAGSRKIDEVSSYWLVQAISELPSDWVVTSGLALGTDAIAHRASMINDLPTIAVLPSGIGNIVPRTNIKIAKEIGCDGIILGKSIYEGKIDLEKAIMLYGD
jgi:DNA processing protein